LTVVIPTFERGTMLLQTIARHLSLNPQAAAIIVVDQTHLHPDAVERRLSELHSLKRIRWIRLREPSQPAAMNVGLICAATDYVLFQDDDVEPCANLIGEYVKTFNELQNIEPACCCIAGQIMQPNQTPVRATKSDRSDFEFPLNSDCRYLIDHAGAGNFCVINQSINIPTFFS
jgi:hypothetical protein